MKILFLSLRAVAYGCVFFLFWWWAALKFRELDPHIGGMMLPWTRWPGAFLLVAGGIVEIACVVMFVARGSGTPAPFDAPRRFVATGLYRWTRNPIYIGALAMLAGLGLFLRSPGILLLAVVFAALAQSLVVWYEEPRLKKKFGAAYEEYLKRVPRWLPKR